MSMHLREFLIQQYQKQGWTVCAELTEINSCVAGGWVGMMPDLLLVKGNRKVAVCIELSSNFVGDFLPKKWSGILRNAGVSLTVVVREERTRDLTLDIARKYDIPLECKLFIKAAQREKKHSGDLLKKRARLFALMIVLLLAFICVALLIPNIRKSEVPDNYRPNDAERQIQTLEKELLKRRMR